MSKTWQYAENQFLNVTDNSYRLALHIGRYHNDALLKNIAIPLINTLYTAYNPLYTAYDDAFDQFVSAGGVSEGGTLNLREGLRILSTKARTWDIAVQNIYPVDTPRYRTLFPDRRIPFQTGSQIMRINAVNSLSINIGAEVALAAVKTDVDNTYTALNDAYTNQGGNKSALAIASAAVDEARIAMCVGMYADCGALMQEYAGDPEMIRPYFDVAAMQKGQQVVFTDNHLKPQTLRYIVKHTFVNTDHIEIENIGDATLRVYLAHNKNDAPAGGYFDSTPHSRQTLSITDIGPVTATFLQVFNLDALLEGQFVLDLNPLVP